MKLFYYGCSRCTAERVFTQRQHDILESPEGRGLRERRELGRHCEPTPESGGPPSSEPCVGALVLLATLNADVST